MKISEDEIAVLKELEESMWREETRFDLDYMERVLSDDFVEFGRSGKIYARGETLSAPRQVINARIPLRDFAVHPIRSDVVLVTYLSEVGPDHSQLGNRSSLWLKTDTGWKLVFHQGTPVSR